MVTYSKNEIEVENLTDGLLRELRSYAEGRKQDVARGAETPELAAVLLEKYAWGLASAVKVLEFPARSIIEEADRLVLQIDPDFAVTKKKRWAARPAGLSFGPTE